MAEEAYNCEPPHLNGSITILEIRAFNVNVRRHFLMFLLLLQLPPPTPSSLSCSLSFSDWESEKGKKKKKQRRTRRKNKQDCRLPSMAYGLRELACESSLPHS